MLSGYAGKIAWIDLAQGSIDIQELDESIARKYIGGKGLGAYLLYKHLKPGTDPLGPENIMIFVTGPLTGTTFPAVSRSGLITRSRRFGTSMSPPVLATCFLRHSDSEKTQGCLLPEIGDQYI
ncbi:MAG: hypothetical protein DRI57_28960 [Deltaproteobacteria bacterium]|nr:MAG: hypothetical protein DRI57_28960 [Deltaproteobacteria bacterium]